MKEVPDTGVETEAPVDPSVPYIHVQDGSNVIKMDLPLPEAIEDRLTAGQLLRVNEDGSSYDADAAKRPLEDAPKAEWIDYTVSDSDLDYRAVSSKTKAQLIAMANNRAAVRNQARHA
jgi:hypothetical protein